jgi:hypothetical protein
MLKYEEEIKKWLRQLNHRKALVVVVVVVMVFVCVCVCVFFNVL